MATNYPSSTDVFNVPISPSTTPLSSAGTGSRNHVTHHRDLGDAVMALEANASQKTHAHGGVGLDGPKLTQASTHQNADTDVSDSSIHHTLGVGAFQGAKGDHTHSQYVDTNTTQDITGFKHFLGTGGLAPSIDDFNRSQHAHMNAVTGGPAFPAVATATYDHGTDKVLAGNGTLKVDLTNPFYIPNNTVLNGVVYLQYRTTEGNTEHQYAIYAAVSYGSSGITYSPSENITMVGFNDRIGPTGKFAFITGQLVLNPYRQCDVVAIPFSVSAPTPRPVSNTSRLKIYLISEVPQACRISAHVQYWVSPNIVASSWANAPGTQQ